MKEFWELLKKFWADNIKKNYKKISIIIGSLVSGLISAVIGIVCGMVESSTLPTYIGSGLVGMLTVIEMSTIGICIIIFGKAQNGNGYKVPANKDFQVLYKTDEEYKSYTDKKLIEHIEKNGNGK